MAMTSWNTHCISKSSGCSSPGGIPDELYFLPENSNAVDHGKAVDLGQLAGCHEFAAAPRTVTGHAEFEEYFGTICTQLGLERQSMWPQCVHLYLNLRDVARNGRPS